MTYSFVLDNPQSSKPTYIFLLMPCVDGRLKTSLKEKIIPKDWNTKFQRPEPTKDKKLQDEYKAIHKKLERIDNRLTELINDSRITGKPLFKKNVQFEIDQILNKTVAIDTNDFFACADKIFEEMKNGTLLTRSGKRFSKGTLKNYDQSIRFLKDFSHKHSVNFSDVTLDTYREFVKFLNEQEYSMNYVGQHIKNWKKLMGEAFERGWHKNTIYSHKDFQTLDEQTYDIYLTEEELSKMFNQNLSYNPAMEFARDWFILDCYTGLRVSDLKLLDAKNILKDRITIVNEKTDAKVVIPIHPYVRQILKKYKGLPPKINEQEINDNIKKVGEICGINRTEVYTVTEGGVRRDYYLKRYEMISNHSARRSYVSNLIKAGVPHAMVMRLSGIKKYETLSRYIKLTEDEVAEEVAKHSFFSDKKP